MSDKKKVDIAEKMRDRQAHLSTYDVLDRQDGPVKAAVIETIKEMKSADTCIVAARTNPETKQATVKVIARRECGPFGFDGPFGSDPFEQSPAKPDPSTSERELTVSKAEAKAFFGEEPVLASGQLGMTVVRRIHRGQL